jgi:site-specific DNA recombinase
VTEILAGIYDVIITKDAFEQVQARFASRCPQSSRAVVRGTHSYVFKGLVTHAACGRKMQGNWFHDAAFYRCRYPREYAIANSVEHPINVFVKEEMFVEPIDRWLAEVFAPDRVECVLSQLEASQPDAMATSAPLKRSIAECDRKLARHRAALEAGAAPAMVAVWSSDVHRERTAGWPSLRRRIAPCRTDE